VLHDPSAYCRVPLADDRPKLPVAHEGTLLSPVLPRLNERTQDVSVLCRLQRHPMDHVGPCSLPPNVRLGQVREKDLDRLAFSVVVHPHHRVRLDAVPAVDEVMQATVATDL